MTQIGSGPVNPRSRPRASGLGAPGRPRRRPDAGRIPRRLQPVHGTTTVIPYGAAAAMAGSGGRGLQPARTAGAPALCPAAAIARHAAPESAEVDEDEHDDRLNDVGRRGTQHLGLLVLRVGLGVVLGAHGLQKLFGWWGGSGVSGFRNSLSDVGYQHADILAYVSAGGELVAGVLLVLGLVHPAGRGGCAGVPDQRSARRPSRRGRTRATSRSSCPTGTNTRSP